MSNFANIELLGLTELQADVIITLLELGGEGSAPDIIEKLSQTKKINRTSIYTVLNKLETLGLIISAEGGKSTTYSLISTSVDDLIEQIIRPQKQATKKFREQLEEAKQRQRGKVEYEFYYLQDSENLLQQTRMMLRGASEFILLMANIPMLHHLLDNIREIYSEDMDLLIIPTWNPDPELDTVDVLSNYRELVGKEKISAQLKIFDHINPIVSQIMNESPEEFVKLGSSIHFIQLLTDRSWLLGNFLKAEGSISSGIFSREPLISQMMVYLFLDIFISSGEFDEKQVDEILKTKTLSSIKTIKDSFRSLQSK